MSFQKAAAELGVTPRPSAIKSVRSSRSVDKLVSAAAAADRLTSAGARLFPVATGWSRRVRAGVAGVAGEGEHRPLRLTTTNAFAALWLVPRLPLWREAHPGSPWR